MSQPEVEPRAVTPVFGWHVPVLGDVPNVPADMSALATGIEATMVRAMGGVAGFITQTGTIANAPAAPTRVTTMTGAGTGGVTISNGLLTLPLAGLYVVYAGIQRGPGNPALYQLGIGTAAAVLGDGWIDVQTQTDTGSGPVQSSAKVFRFATTNWQLGLWFSTSGANVAAMGGWLQALYLGP